MLKALLFISFINFSLNKKKMGNYSNYYGQKLSSNNFFRQIAKGQNKRFQEFRKHILCYKYLFDVRTNEHF